jgi:hypothetical protein
MEMGAVQGICEDGFFPGDHMKMGIFLSLENIRLLRGI